MALHVHHEWDRLTQTIVGNPYTRLGTSLPALAAKYMPAVSLQIAQEQLREHAGKTLREAIPILHDMAAEQMAAASAILRDRGIEVHEVLPLLPHEETYLADLGYGNAQQFFPRDPIVVIGDQLIELAMRYPMRRMERFGVRRTLADLVPAQKIVSMPEPLPIPEQVDPSFGPGPFLEGGDVLLLGDDICVGTSGNASDMSGVAWLQRHLGDEKRVHQVDLSPRFLHLDCVLSTPREGLAVVCREGFPNGLPDVLADWDVIDVPAEAAETQLAVNVLVLDERTVMVASETPQVADDLAAAGQEVITTPFAAISLWGGSFRCWHHPLRRDSS